MSSQGALVVELMDLVEHRLTHNILLNREAIEANGAAIEANGAAIEALGQLVNDIGRETLRAVQALDRRMDSIS